MLDKRDVPVGPSLSPQDWCAAAIEGTVRATRADGTSALLNFDERGGTSVVDCAPHVPPSRHASVPVAALGRTRWRRAYGPYGDGGRSWVLVPFRTVAVDPRVVPLGSVLYVPAARGAKFQHEGRSLEHDGYFFAADTGGAIRGNHIDVFTGTVARSPLAFVRSRPAAVFDAFVVRDPALIERFDLLHTRR
jgi:3D (Asp-Asp-Asp) domain-containing protein